MCEKIQRERERKRKREREREKEKEKRKRAGRQILTRVDGKDHFSGS